ncbi:MAG: DUF4340 domain-containing protein [Candidatus Auribacter fodinae]|jgi:hypothetical protein|uniref:DUF4340 domain-containing protein n=1 Tax=Candidatus Auribacter fodinae TaxID=2093366 RepID=A0A3A4R3E3_9BACT|nr:MAG: DUF4340 domain-containing protein [Candidatus Auribacter fodinae]
MKLKKLIFLSIILCALSGYIYFFERHTPDTETKKARQNRVLPFQAKEITGLTIENRFGNITLAKSDNTNEWVILPEKYRTADMAISTLLSELELLTYLRQIDEGQDSFGFTTPLATITIAVKTQSYTVVIGAPAALGEQRYVRVSTNEIQSIYVVDSHPLEKFNLPPEEIRSRSIIPDKTYVPDYIQIQRDSLTITIEHKKEGVWYLSSPLQCRADQDRVRAVVSAFQNLRAIDFIDVTSEPDNEYGFNTPSTKVTLGKKDTQLYTIRIGKEYDNGSRYYIKNDYESFVYGIERMSAKLFFSSLYELSTKQFFLYAQEDIDSLILKSDSLSLELQSENGKWKIKRPVEIFADTTVIENLFKSLQSCTISEYLTSIEERNLITSLFPLYTLEITPQKIERHTKNTFLFYSANEHYYVSDGESVYKIDNFDQSVFPMTITDIAATDISLINRYTLARMEFRRANVPITLELRGSNWFLDKKALAQAEINNILNILQLIKPRKIYAVANEQTMRECGLEQPSIQITYNNINTESPAETILFGIQADNLIYGHKKGYPLIFLFDAKTVESMTDTLMARGKNVKNIPASTETD